MEIVAQFEGDVAERHLLPAFEGSQSIEGLARTISLVAHYVATAEVRKRYPFDEHARVYISPARAGSFDTLFHLWTDSTSSLLTTPIGVVGLGIVSILTVELLKVLTHRAIGRDHTPQRDDISRLIADKSGDIEALGEAVEPSLKKSHTVINNGAGRVAVISGSNNIVIFNPATKNYIFSSDMDNTTRQLLVSVGMLNVNTRNGRVYNHELGRTVPIYVVKDANPRTLPNLARSLQRYSARSLQHVQSEIVIVFTTERSLEGVDKKYFVQDAFFSEP